MFSQLSVAFALFMASAQVLAAQPPACLLAAVNTEKDPSDLATICGKDASKVEAQIHNLCGDNADAAMSAFTSTCKNAGHAIAAVNTTSSATPSAYGSSTATSMLSFKSSVTPRPSGTLYSPVGTGTPYITKNSTVIVSPTLTPTMTMATVGITKTAAPTSTSSRPATGAASTNELSMFALVLAGAAAALL